MFRKVQANIFFIEIKLFLTNLDFKRSQTQYFVLSFTFQEPIMCRKYQLKDKKFLFQIQIELCPGSL